MFKFKKNLSVGLGLCLLTSCTSFSKLSQFNTIMNDVGFTFRNTKVGAEAKFYGDFKLANSMKDFRKLNEEKPKFKYIILYGKTYVPPIYDVYITEGFAEKQEGYSIHDTLIKDRIINFIISDLAPRYDKEFLLNEL